MSAATLRRWTNLALPMCLVAVDACWIYAITWLFGATVLYFINSQYFAVPSPILLAVLEGTAWLLVTYLMDRTRIAMQLLQTIGAVVGITLAVMVALAYNPPAGNIFAMQWLAPTMYNFLICIVVWFVGAFRAGQKAPDFGTAYRSFRAGLIALGIGIGLSAAVSGDRREDVWAGLGSAALWFFAWSLAALAFGNREMVRAETKDADIKSWNLVLGGSLGTILLIGLASGGFGGKSLTDVVAQVIGALLTVSGIIIYAFTAVVLWMVSTLDVDMRPFEVVEEEPEQAPPAGTSDWLERLRDDYRNTAPAELPPEIQAIGMLVVITVIIVGVVWLFGFFTKRRRRGIEGEAGEVRESFGSWGLLWQQAAAWLGRLLARFRPAHTLQTAPAEDDMAALQGRPEWSGTLSIRQIYARLQSAAGRLGYPRAPQQTPVEYLGVLSRAMPQLGSEFGQITAAYLEARYGPLPASAPAVRAATDAWQRAEQALKSANAYGRNRDG